MSRITRGLVSAFVAGGLASAAFLVADARSGRMTRSIFLPASPAIPKRASRVVAITMTEEDGKMLFKPNRLVVRRGEQIRFVLANAGYLDHEFMIATVEENKKHAALMQKYPDMEHDDPNGKTVKTKQKGELIWRFTRRGEFEFACLIPGHYEAGMIGTVVVK